MTTVYTRPTYWCWGAPLGAAASDARYIKMYRFGKSATPANSINDGATGTAIADLICDEIVARTAAEGDQTGRIGIMLQNWGKGNYDNDGVLEDVDNDTSLWREADDGTGVNTVNPSFHPGWVPFFANGIAQCRVWTRAFIARYQARQLADASIPDPTAFWMDTENLIFVNTTWTTQWADVKADPRWNTEIITFDDRTWAQVVADEAIPDPADPAEGKKFVNRLHVNGVQPFLMQAQSRAMEKGLFELVQAAWPRCFTANWLTTHAGLHDLSADTWNYSAVTSGTHQTPVLYENLEDFPVNFPKEIRPGVHSSRPYAPWIRFVGNGQITAENVADFHEWYVFQSAFSGIRHLLVWGSDEESTGGEMLVVSNWDAWYESANDAETRAAAAFTAIAVAEENEMSNKAPQTYTKHPDEVRNATMSFKYKLSGGDSLTGTPTVVASPSGPTFSSVQVTTSTVLGNYIEAVAGEAVQFKITGGTDGTTYRLTVTCGTSGGETLVGLADLTVEDEA